MPWSPPSVPISGTTITVAFATSLINNGLNWLRQLTGNADPPGADYVAVSTSTSTTSWQKVTSAVIQDGGVADVDMANQKVNQVNPQYTTFGGITDKGSGFFDVSISGGSDAPTGSANWMVNQVRHWNHGQDYRWQLAVQLEDSTQMYARSVIAGVGSAWHRLFHSGMDGAGSGIDADLLDGQSSAFYATAASVAAINQVPSGLIAAFATAAAIAAGWARYTAADGRILIGAGTTFSQTFTENNNAGSSNWTPLTGVSTGAASTAVLAGQTTGANTNVTPDHTHPIPTTTWIPPVRVVVHAQKS
jgi:hypothetical protein